MTVIVKLFDLQDQCGCK